jgi:hypothetical protein
VDAMAANLRGRAGCGYTISRGSYMLELPIRAISFQWTGE